MNFTKHTLILSALAISLVAVACSSDDAEKGSTGVDSGLPADKQLGELTADEITQLNNAGEAYATQQSSTLTKEQACQSEAFSAGAEAFQSNPTTATDASMQQACTDEYDACVAGSGTWVLGSQTVTQASLTGCAATVGEAETCFTDLTAASLASFKAVPACSSLTVAGAATAATGFTTPATCLSLVGKCPTIASAF